MQIDDLQSFKQQLKTGPAFGPFSKSGDPAFVEAAGYAGFDFIILDLEHAPTSTQTLQHLIRAAEIGGVVPIVRVKESPSSLIGEVLDVGAAGVQVPQINSAEAASNAVKAARFAPLGERGVCRFVRAANYSALKRERYFQDANQALVILQLEGKQALQNLQSIIAVPGIDVIFIGPYDLSQSLGHPGDVQHPEVVAATAEITRDCLQRGITVGTFVDTMDAARHWMAAGVRYLSYSVDIGIFTDACRSLVTQLHGDFRREH